MFLWKKVLKNKGILNEEEEQNLLCEVYIALLLFLHNRIFYVSIYDFQIKNYYIADTLYFLKIFGKIDIVDNQLSVDFIVRYCESINVLCKDNTFWFPTSNRHKKGPHLTFWQYTFNERSGDFFD